MSTAALGAGTREDDPFCVETLGESSFLESLLQLQCAVGWHSRYAPAGYARKGFTTTSRPRRLVAILPPSSGQFRGPFGDIKTPIRNLLICIDISPGSSDSSRQVRNEVRNRRAGILGKKKALENLRLSECYQFCSSS